MTIQGRFEGVLLRQRMTYKFDVPAVPPAAADLNYVRASGLAQVRLQLAVLSGNRRGALRELDRLVEIDRQLEALSGDRRLDGALPAGTLKAQLDEQRRAIATEKLALMAATEFPRLPAAERACEETDYAEPMILEDTEFGRKFARTLAWLLGFIVIGTLLAFALPALAAF